MCVATRHFTTALPVLSVPITQIDTSLSDITYNDNLVYHYAGGMAFAALKQWTAAEGFFDIVVGSPAQLPSAIQLEALKKLALVQLILYGKVSLLCGDNPFSFDGEFHDLIWGLPLFVCFYRFR